MTVADLIQKLQAADPNAIVVIPIGPGDTTGYPLDVVEIQRYDRDTGEYGHPELTPQLEEQGYTEEDVNSDGIPCVVLHRRSGPVEGAD